MRQFIRIICLALAIVLILCACGEAAAEEKVPEYDFGSGISAEDMGGFRLVWGWSGATGSSVFGFVPETALADTVVERRKEVEKDLNCVIELRQSSTMVDNFRSGILAGFQDYDIVSTGGALRTDARAGNLMGLSSLLDVRNTDKWGTPNMLQPMLWNEDVYGVVPFAWPDLIYRLSGHVFAVNENIVSRIAQPDPREFVEKGEWTWDRFEEVLRDYTFEEAGRTVYGARICLEYFAVNFLLSNGVAISSYQDGKVVAGAYTEAGREAMDRCQKVFYETSHDFFHPLTDSVGDDEFSNGESVMYLTWLAELTADTKWIMYNMDNIGVLPFPQGPKATPGKYLSYNEGLLLCFAIPVNARDPYASAKIMSAMAEPFDAYKTKDDIIDYMTSQIFFDRRDVEIVVNEVTNTEYGFFSEGARGVLEGIIKTRTSISQVLESNASKYETIVEDYMIPVYHARVAVYGE